MKIHSGIVSIANLIIIETAIGRNVSIRTNIEAVTLGIKDAQNTIHGIIMETIVIQKFSITKLDRLAVFPTLNMRRKNQAIIPV